MRLPNVLAIIGCYIREIYEPKSSCRIAEINALQYEYPMTVGGAVLMLPGTCGPTGLRTCESEAKA